MYISDRQGKITIHLRVTNHHGVKQVSKWKRGVQDVLIKSFRVHLSHPNVVQTPWGLNSLR